jgi:uncharacterized protein with FMN-binding domain
MRRLALLVVATAAVIALVVTVRPHHKTVEHRPAAIDSTTTRVTSTGTHAPTPSPRYRSGTATALAHTDFGDVQVRVTVASGRIAHATAVEIPHGNPMDVELSRPAVRTLEQEVLRTQRTDVDVVSGATYTSTGYLTSLQAALDRLSQTDPSAATTTAS